MGDKQLQQGETVHQKRLRDFFPYVPLLDVDHLVIRLRSCRIKDEEAEEILSEKTTSKKGRALLELLIRKAEFEGSVVNELAKELFENKQSHLAHVLRPGIYDDDGGLFEAETLIKNWKKLAAELPTKPIVKWLFEADVLTMSDREMISSHETTEKRNDHLLQILCKKPKIALMHLKAALRHEKHKLFFLFCGDKEKKLFEEEEKRLRDFFSYAHLLDVDHLLIRLRRQWINDKEADEIQSKSTTQAKGRALLDLLIEKATTEGSPVVDDLAKALYKNKQSHLAHKLQPDLYDDQGKGAV